MNLLKISSLILIIVALANAQNYVIVGGAIHTGKGNVIENTNIVIEKGLIKSISNAIDTASKKVIYAKGKHIYPGLILLNSNIGLNEIEAVRATQDNTEVGLLNPNIRSAVAFNSDSDIIPTLRSNGILMAQIVPRGALLPGSSSVMQFTNNGGKSAEYQLDEGLHIVWPTYYAAGQGEDNSYADTRKKQIALLEKLFTDAEAYFKITQNNKNLKLESLKPVFEGSQSLYIRVHYSKEAIEALAFVRKFKIKKVVFVGAKECKSVLNLIAENKIPVVLDRIHSLPPHMDSEIQYSYTIPFEMKKAGIQVALSYEGDMEAMGSRNLSYLAGTASAYGMNKEDALSLITYNAAQILGIADKTGSIETGKEANLVISEGDIMDMKTSTVEIAMLKGVLLDLNDKQKELYRRYKKLD
ncbi:MAG: amidohydrolase family protein [Bacteroidota bacterium]|nr:amidohydrolase family protein [Bacteroidota bacterium]